MNGTGQDEAQLPVTVDGVAELHKGPQVATNGPTRYIGCCMVLCGFIYMVLYEYILYKQDIRVYLDYTKLEDNKIQIRCSYISSRMAQLAIGVILSLP